ncbi:hypothetical protein Ahy_B08g092245 isoform L [Arachis hypogaea]|uniref:Uncharacterized protein n=1 Tax=Arachis hypogaea TaxID=3818 RepID=A0A444Y3Q1_ARAHY|nr:hypothetical protein Ahy_B08g092245 isoform L [Arachis hypogaea]
MLPSSHCTGYHARIARSSALEIASFAEGDNAFYTEDIETYWSYSNMLAIPYRAPLLVAASELVCLE